MYASKQESQLAKDLGFTENRDQHSGSSFDLGLFRVWAAGVGLEDYGWQTADLDYQSYYYKNHKKFADLSDALRYKAKQHVDNNTVVKEN